MWSISTVNRMTSMQSNFRTLVAHLMCDLTVSILSWIRQLSQMIANYRKFCHLQPNFENLNRYFSNLLGSSKTNALPIPISTRSPESAPTPHRTPATACSHLQSIYRKIICIFLHPSRHSLYPLRSFSSRRISIVSTHQFAR